VAAENVPRARARADDVVTELARHEGLRAVPQGDFPNADERGTR